MTAGLDVFLPTLSDCEQVIERGLTTFVEVGQALATIRDGRLYKDGHATFEDYCRDRWGFNDSRARQLIAASEVAKEIGTVTNVTVTNEGQARALGQVTKQHGPEAAAEVLEEVAATGPVTATRITEVAQQRNPITPEAAQAAEDLMPTDPYAGWSKAERDALATFQTTGRSIVINMAADATLGPRLWAWAETNGHAVRIDRRTKWGNPFVLPDDGQRTHVIDAYANHYLPNKPSLQASLHELLGKILGCWCAPMPCHGDALLAEVYR